MSLLTLKQQLENSKVIQKGKYQYIINSICEQEPPLEPSILTDCADKLLAKLNWKEANKILTPEVMGIHLATTIALKTNLPLIIATRREKRIDKEKQVQYRTGYDNGVLHINGIYPGDKILIIDDLISTGGTLISLIDGVKHLKASVADIGVIFNKTDYYGMIELTKMGYSPKTLLDVKIINNKVNVSIRA